MKNKIHIRLVAACLLLAIFLPTTIFAALPPSVEPQWTNTSAVVCQIIVSNGTTTAHASITGYTGTTVEATATLYKVKNGKASIEYFGSTPENNPYPFASFSYEFDPEAGATYHLVLDGTVSGNNYVEPIYFTDSETF